MNRHLKGFTLTELLMALVIHSFFILMLGGTFYTLLSFGSRSQELLTARERGQRALNYIDARVRNTGLGMWKLENWQDVRKALKPLTDSSHVFGNENMRLPIMIWSNDTDTGTVTKKSDITHKAEHENIYCGKFLTLLYAQRDTDTTPDAPVLAVYQWGVDPPNYSESVLNDLMDTLQNEDNFWREFFPEKVGSTVEGKNCLDLYKKYIENGQSIKDAAENTLKDKYGSSTKEKIKALTGYSKIIDYVSDDIEQYPIEYKFLYNRDLGEFFYSDFGVKKKNNNTVEDYNIKAWGVSRGFGVPFIVDPASDRKTLKLTAYSPDIVPNGDELLYLRGVQIYSGDPLDSDPEQERSLKIRKLEGTSWPDNGVPYQVGILEIYAELDTKNQILSVWVLSSGGRDNMIHERPSYDEWPEPANWLDDFKYHVTYVSKGTWKLHNLRDDFYWGD